MIILSIDLRIIFFSPTIVKDVSYHRYTVKYLAPISKYPKNVPGEGIPISACLGVHFYTMGLYGKAYNSVANKSISATLMKDLPKAKEKNKQRRIKTRKESPLAD